MFMYFLYLDIEGVPSTMSTFTDRHLMGDIAEGINLS